MPTRNRKKTKPKHAQRELTKQRAEFSMERYLSGEAPVCRECKIPLLGNTRQSLCWDCYENYE